MSIPTLYGSCMCGAVRFEVDGELGDIDACHCVECRKWTGHFLVSGEVAESALKLTQSEQLAWFHSSDQARRGFCQRCGSSLFFEPLDKSKHDWISVSMGALESSAGKCVEKHIFVAEKGDYYTIDDGLPQNDY